MKLALHIVRKDVRHLWLPLAVWAALLLADLLVVGVFLGQPGSVRSDRVARVAAFLLRPLQTLLLVITVPLIVQDDPAVGTTAFWLTRPIPRATMLAAKAILVGGLFVIAPTLAEVAILGLRSTSPHEISLAIPETLLGWTWWAATVAALAALTSTFARFALAGAIVTVTVMVLGVAGMVADLYLDLGRRRPSGEDFLALAASRSILEWLVYAAAAGAAVTHQYVTRRTRVSVVIAIGGALVALGVGTAWPWSFLPGERAVLSPLAASGMTIDVAPSHVAEQTAIPGYASDRLQVLGHLRLGGVPEDRAVDAVVIKSDLMFPGEASLTLDGSGQDAAEAWLSPRWDPALVQRVLGDVSFVNPEHAPNPFLVLAVITRAAYQRQRGTEGTYRASVKLSVLKYEVGEVQPLTRQPSADGLSRVTILGVERSGDATVVLARETVLQLLFRGESRWLGASMWAELGRRSLYVLRNRDRREALWPSSQPFTDVDPLILFEILSDRPLKQHVRRLVYQSPRTTGPEWLTQAELIRIEAREVGSATRDVVIVPFVLPPSLR